MKTLFFLAGVVLMQNMCFAAEKDFPKPETVCLSDVTFESAQVYSISTSIRGYPVVGILDSKSGKSYQFYIMGESSESFVAHAVGYRPRSEVGTDGTETNRLFTLALSAFQNNTKVSVKVRPTYHSECELNSISASK